jgi:hypothetical protein
LARYQVTGLGYFGPTANSAAPMLHPPGSIIEMADDGPCSLYWLPIDEAANAAIARQQQLELRKRGGNTNWSVWGSCMPHGDGTPPAENWPPPDQQQPVTSRSWPPRSRIARHNR